jgi:uncharacterized phage protein (TIGR02220 family)
MSIHAMNWAWGHTLPPTEKLVLLAIADRANDDGICWPGQASLAKKVGVTDRTIRTACLSLQERGLLSIAHRHGEGRQTNIYTLHMSQPENISAIANRKSTTANRKSVQANRKSTTANRKQASANTSEETSVVIHQKETREGSPSSHAAAVFDYWQERTGHHQAILTDKRLKAIKGRLKQGYSVERLKAAVDGCLKSEFHQGKNDNATVYDDIELICRSGEKVEQFERINTQTSKAKNDIDAWLREDTCIEGSCYAH